MKMQLCLPLFLAAPLTTQLYGGLYLVLQGRMSVGAVLALQLATNRLKGEIGFFLWSFRELIQALAGTERLFEVLDEPAEDDAWLVNAQRDAGDKAYALECRDVRFAYPSRPDQPVLDGMSFAVRHGERVALVGGTLTIEAAAGAGTTLFAQIPIPPQHLDE
jgi:ABC-type multidrug transport system fused ATPase/permease subunit